jgi:hypothetical protein
MPENENRERTLNLTHDYHAFCDITRPAKYRHDTLDSAWLLAWYIFALGKTEGVPLTPYRCTSMRRYGPRARQIVQQNPWRWSPPTYVKIELIRTFPSRSRTPRTCGGWHLTRSTAHILPSSNGPGQHGIA